MSAELFTATQVGQLLDVDTSTVYRMAGDGRLPAVRVGRQWRFPADRIAHVLETGIPAATTASPVPAPAPSPSLRTDLLAAVVDLVAESLGVMMVVTDMQGRPLTHVANPCAWFEAHTRDEGMVAECVEEWRELAEDVDLSPRFRTGRHPFQCARSFVRSGTELVGMVLAGGVAPEGPDGPATEPDGLHHLDPAAREHVLEMLPRIAASLSRLSTPTRSSS